MQMGPLFPGVRVKKDSILDAGHDRTLVSHIDRDRITNMNRLAVVVAHWRSSTNLQKCGGTRFLEALRHAIPSSVA
jgi:hypothetical protein